MGTYCRWGIFVSCISCSNVARAFFACIDDPNCSNMAWYNVTQSPGQRVHISKIVYHSKLAPIISDTTYVNCVEGSPRMALSQRSIINVHMWISLSPCLVKWPVWVQWHHCWWCAIICCLSWWRACYWPVIVVLVFMVKMCHNSNGHFNRMGMAIAPVSNATSAGNCCSFHWWLKPNCCCQQRPPFWQKMVPFLLATVPFLKINGFT